MAALSRHELDQVLGSGLVTVQPLREAGLYELRPGSIVGAVVLPGLRLLIQPKIALDNLFFLLGYGAGLTSWRPDPFPFTEEPDLLRAIGWVLDAEVRKAVRGGLVRGYQPREETLPTLRGRIDVAAQVGARQHQPYPLECRYDEYTADIELNRMVKAAILRLLRVPALDARLSQALRFRLHSFQEVRRSEYTAAAVPNLTFDRLNARWEVAGRLSQLILRSESLRDAEGQVLGTGFTVDMNRLFEQFVETVTREAALKTGWRLEAQGHRKLSPGVTMQPDLVIRRGGRDYAVGDVKYKAPEQGWTHPDLYQMLAYCIALGLPTGLLIYAGNRPPETHVVVHSGIALEIVGLHLDGTRDEVLTRTRSIGQHLVERAERCRTARNGQQDALRSSPWLDVHAYRPGTHASR